MAALTWGSYSALVGFIGGVAFERNVLMGLLVGFGLAAAITAVAELGRRLLRRGRQRPATGHAVCAAPGC